MGKLLKLWRILPRIISILDEVKTTLPSIEQTVKVILNSAKDRKLTVEEIVQINQQIILLRKKIEDIIRLFS